MKSNKQAFTLIELLVVVLIIGILAAVAVPQYQQAVRKSQFTQAFVALKATVQAEEVYFLAHGNYTSDLSELDAELPNLPTGWRTFMVRVSSQEEVALNVQMPKMGVYLSYYFYSKQTTCQATPSNKIGKQLCMSFAHTKADCLAGDKAEGFECYYY